VACGIAAWLAVATGLETAGHVADLFIFLGAGQLCFYIALRSGFNRRFGDPALTAAQMFFAAVGVAAAYMAIPTARSFIPVLMCLVLVYGAFTLTPLQCRRLGWLCAGVQMAAYLLAAESWAGAFAPSVALFQILLGMFIFVVIGDLAAQLSALRHKLRSQKAALNDALTRMHTMATHDELTGLPNRRQAIDLLAHEERRSMRQARPPCIGVLDIDNFKRVNDSLGHQAGDETLRQFSKILTTALRPGDVLARWGGEEFLLLLPDTPMEDALQVLERLRERCAQPSSWAPSEHLRVTFSAGLVCLTPPETTDAAIARADDALYVAKASGRNCIRTA
jgi:diguanylate cyclase (GGDEF)-like protein